MLGRKEAYGVLDLFFPVGDSHGYGGGAIAVFMSSIDDESAFLFGQLEYRVSVDPENPVGLDSLDQSEVIPAVYRLRRDAREAGDLIGFKKRLERQVSRLRIAPSDGLRTSVVPVVKHNCTVHSRTYLIHVSPPALVCSRKRCTGCCCSRIGIRGPLWGDAV
jgi:hypothetical protein